MHDHRAVRLELQNFARSHPTRFNILTLMAKYKKRLGLRELRRGLPGQPLTSVVRYHLKVLASAALLPPGDSDDIQG